MNLHYNFWKTKKSISASREFKKQLWSKLDTRWQELNLPNYNWYQTRLFRWVAEGATAMALFMGFGAGTYAYTAPQVTEGKILYPIKKKIEFVEEKLSRSPRAKANFYLKSIEKREQEKKIMEEEKSNKIENVDAQIQKLDEKDDFELKDKVRRVLERRKAHLEDKVEKFEEKKGKFEEQLKREINSDKETDLQED